MPLSHKIKLNHEGQYFDDNSSPLTMAKSASRICVILACSSTELNCFGGSTGFESYLLDITIT